jgi:UDP-GlcNAc:undecaprenyl-phosphate GlcNAc-1-phosphate transferase
MPSYLIEYQLILILIIFYLQYLKREKISKFFGLLDYPDNIRKFHSKTTPLLGGVFLYSVLIVIFFFEIYFEKKIYPFFSILVFSSFSFLIGILDDKFNIKHYYKLFFIGLFLIIFLLNNDEYLLKNLYFLYYNKLYTLSKLPSLFLTTLCILLLINAFNMTDGINGLSVGIAFLWLLILFSFLKLPDKYLLILIILLVMFFLVYKEKFFLGDSGSLLLSSFIGLTSIYYYNQNIYINYNISVEEIVLIFFIPGFDMFRLFVKRILNKKNPFVGDRNHLHHILIINFGLKSSLIIYYALIVIPYLLFKFFSIEIIYLFIIQIIIVFFLINYSKNIKFDY